MNASHVLAALAALPGSRRLAAAPPITASIEVAGIEVATAGAHEEPVLRRTWRERHRGATPLLLLSDQGGNPSAVAVLGPSDGAGPMRTVDTAALERLLRRVSSLPRLDAIRELAGELERLDQAGIPGVRLRDLLTTYTLDRRLRGDPVRWSAASTSADAIPSGADWRGVLNAFGYQIDRRPARGYLLRYGGRPVSIVHPKANASELARLDAEGRPPEGQLLNDCIDSGVRYGMLTAGPRFRLFDFSRGDSGATSRYLDLDAALLQADDRPLLALLGPAYLAEGGFANLVAEAAAFGARLRRRLDERIRQDAFPALARGLEAWARAHDMDLSEETYVTDLERASMTLLFRLLFLLFAESSGYLPMDNDAYRQASITALVGEASATRERLDRRSTSLWDRTQVVIRTMRTGNQAWRVPDYDGALFAPEGFDGAVLLEQLSITDPDYGDILVAIGRDAETGTGVDYSTLEIGHLGHIYEALLSLRLTVAQRDLRYDHREDRYRPVLPGEQTDVTAGSLLWMTHEGGRKSGGVYYTRSELVRHLVLQSVGPAFERHLEEVRTLAERDAMEAARHLLDFAVVDPACGSAHFLVEVIRLLADRTVGFLADHPLPEIADAVSRLRAGALKGSTIDDAVLIGRLVLKHCVYGVDISSMGAEVAKVSLWLSSFVPGLSLAYLDGNLKVGNSLIGVVLTESVGAGKYVAADWTRELQRAAAAAARAADIHDRNREEVLQSERAGAEARAASRPVERLFNLWTAEAFGLTGAREELDAWAKQMLEGRRQSSIQGAADDLAQGNAFLHWPVEFPRVFARDRPGFDAVVGNPPWDEVTVEELGFYGLFAPGLRGMPERDRREAIDRLLNDRPELVARLEVAQERASEGRSYLARGEYTSMAGDPDLYKYFCQRYRLLLRDGGELGVVLPRSAFLTKGSTGFREWLFGKTTCRRLDFLVNTGRWAFDSEPRYTVGLVAASGRIPNPDHKVRVAGVADSLDRWNEQVARDAVEVSPGAMGDGGLVPLLRDSSEDDLLSRLRRGSPFPFGSSDRWRCFPVAELHETNDARLWRGATEGSPLWKGESFDQYYPSGAQQRLCPVTPALLKKIRKPRPGSDSRLAVRHPLESRRTAVLRELGRARVAFRDVSRATDSRTVRACLVPQGVVLTNTGPYLAFTKGGPAEQSACLAILNSLPFDWQARRFVETHLNFFVLEALRVPALSDDDFAAISRAAAQLSCVDDRFTDFAQAFGTVPRELRTDEREHLRMDIDARVARSWGLSANDLQIMFRDFTLDAVPANYRERLRARLADL